MKKIDTKSLLIGILATVLVMVAGLFPSSQLNAEPSPAAGGALPYEPIGKYQILKTEKKFDKQAYYLLDTSTGQTWVTGVLAQDATWIKRMKPVK